MGCSQPLLKKQDFKIKYCVMSLRPVNQRLLLLLTALWPYYLTSSKLFSGKFSAGKDSQTHYNNFELVSGSVVRAKPYKYVIQNLLSRKSQSYK